jgi:hypothetical protein
MPVFFARSPKKFFKHLVRKEFPLNDTLTTGLESHVNGGYIIKKMQFKNAKDF